MMEFLIPLLFFLFPVAVAILDKRAKARKAASQPGAAEGGTVSSRRLPNRLDSARTDDAPGSRAWAPDRDSDYPAIPLEGAQGVKESPSAVQAEGARAISRTEKKKEEGQQEEKKLEIDKKKLILYSEILKPKFDA